jgi:AraC-like DNA-binding protein
MSILAALLPNSARLQRLRAAVATRHEIVACADWQELTRLCESTAVQVVVVDFCAVGQATFDEMRLLKARFPRIALIGYVGMPPARASDLFDAGRFGLVGLIVADDNDTLAGILAVIEQAETRGVAQLLARSLQGAPLRVRDAMLLTVTRASSRLTPTTLVRILGVSRRGLAQQLVTAGYPPPQRIITWGRLIVAAHLLESTRMSADAIASALHFPSGSAFRNTCQRYLHATPSEMRARGGSDYVVRALMRELRAHGATPHPLPLSRTRTRPPMMAV